MSATALPTKPYGERPPIFPPVRTTFDGAGGDDSWLTRMTDEVRRICRFADATDGDQLATMIPLLNVRRARVIEEILGYNALGDFPLPPNSNIPIDFLL